MDEQNKEKVLHGLNSCGFYDGIPNICDITECPYRGYKAYCVHELAHDAGVYISELLKAQEPRVMTVADIVDNYVAPEVVWIEARNNKGDIRVVAGLWNGEYYNMQDDSIMYDLGEEIANNPEGYNTRWRCWTSRPTDMQREAIPWE